MTRAARKTAATPAIKSHGGLSFVPASRIKQGDTFIALHRNAAICVALADATKMFPLIEDSTILSIMASVLRADDDAPEDADLPMESAFMVVLVSR